MITLKNTHYHPSKSKSDFLISHRKSSIPVIFTFYLLFTLLGCAALAQEAGEWNCFHGLDRTNKSKETGLLKRWPDSGPELLWTVSGLSEGYSSVSIAKGMLFTAGKADNQTYVFAYDLNGTLVWKKPNGKAWETTASWALTYTGSRSTPTYDDGNVYHMGELGRLASFEYKTGNEIWSCELMELFNAEIPEYGFTESVLIDGQNLYCTPAGKKGFLICLDKKTGKFAWANTEIQGSVGYSSLIISEFGGYRQLVGMSSNCVYGVDIKTGKLLWSVKFENDHGLNITNPIILNEYVFVSTGYGKGSMLIKLTSSGTEIKPSIVWETLLMDNQHGGVVLNNGFLYGSGNESRGWFCIDFMTGKQAWKTSGVGSLTFADDMLYMLDERGIMKLARAIPEKFEPSGEFKLPSGGKGMYWAHPVVCGGRLYIRHTDKLFAYDISSK
jgi:outer membrane protein assembly factor BamB